MGAIRKDMNGISFQKGNEYLKEFQCLNCHLFITDQDIQQENYSFWFSDYANEITKDYVGNSPCYGADFWLKGVNHSECPDSERCQNCWTWFLAEKVKEYEDNYYCLPCYKEVAGKAT